MIPAPSPQKENLRNTKSIAQVLFYKLFSALAQKLYQ